MATITLTIPDDPCVMTSTADWLYRTAERAQPHPSDEPGLSTAPPEETQETETPEANQDTDLAKTDDGAAYIPWDERIHSSGRTVLQSGKWKKKKGVDPTLVKQVEAELIAALTQGEPGQGTTAPAPAQEEAPAHAPTPPAPAPATETVYLLDGKEWTESQLRASGWDDGGLATLEKKPASPPPQPTTGVTTFPELSKLAQSIDEAKVDAVLQKHGLASLVLAASQPDKIPAIAADLQA